MKYRITPKNLLKIFSTSPIAVSAVISILISMSYKYSLNLADFGDYIKAGSLIKDRINPYEQLMYANSPVSALFFYLISWLLPFSILPIMIHLFNAIGVLFFLNWYIGQKFNALVLYLFGFLLISGVGRALFGNVQVTGITLGLVALAFTFNHKHRSNFFPLILMLLAFEIKPQITIPFLVVFIFQSAGVFKKIGILVVSALTIHSLIELYFGSNLHFTWLEKVLRYSNNSILQSSYEISIWKGINQIFGQEQLLRVLSIISILMTLFLVAKYSKSNPEKAFFLALIFPMFNSYVHLYDYVGVLLIAIKYVTLKRFESSILILPFLLFFPLSKDLFLLSITIELIVISIVMFRVKNRALIWVGAGLFASQIIAYPLTINSNQEIQMSVYLSLCTMLLLFYVYRGIFKKSISSTDLNYG